jgi:hypothetical protein
LISVFKLRKVRKPIDTNPNLKNDLIAKTLNKSVLLEFRLYIGFWIVLCAFVTHGLFQHSSFNPNENKYKALDIAYGNKSSSINNSKTIKIASEISINRSNLENLERQKNKLDDIYLHITIMPLGYPISKSDSIVFSKIKTKIHLVEKKFNQSLYSKNTPIKVNQGHFNEILILLKQLNPAIPQDKKSFLLNWIYRSDHKIELLIEYQKKSIADSLYFVLVKAQTYFIILFLVLTLVGILYWYIVNKENILHFHLSNTKEEAEPLRELEFVKLYITIILVLMVPIIKPLEVKDIQFESPFWNISPQSLSKPNLDNHVDNSKEPDLIINIFDSAKTPNDSVIIKKLEKIIEMNRKNTDKINGRLEIIETRIKKQRGR